MMRQTRYARWTFAFLFLVLISNFLVYRSPFSSSVIPEDSFWLVVGSLVDFAIVIPLLWLLSFRINAKQLLAVIATGLIAARFIIPALYFEPFAPLFYMGLIIEISVLAAELALLVILLIHIPKIRRSMSKQSGSPLFSLFPAVHENIKPNPLVHIVLSEALAFYYAFFTWKKRPPEDPTSITLHKNTSSIAFNIMLIHAIVIETLGIHWWLHDKSAVLSIVLLILNVYSVIYFIGDIQATRLNPLTIKGGNLNVSLGLNKRISAPIESIAAVRWGAKPEADALEFVAKDFEEPEPQVVIDFNVPQQAVLFFGKTRPISQIALKVDDPEKLKSLLNSVK
ncbi:beta-carotene 15,15'-monooxygenase [Planococcus sp. CP5-4]|nr:MULTISPECIES: beta-carotene 15,15'-monooxygenase [unclassified Planococcus (in: firmicutes)]MBW6062351.1 beta-carotene 15,15'-monooxygenase [Planococcus sp. CP5-4]